MQVALPQVALKKSSAVLFGRSAKQSSNQSTRGTVTGVADVLKGKLYVSRMNTQQIEVYCATTFQEQQNVYCACMSCGQQSDTVECSSCRPMFGSQLRNMVACDTNNCLYACDDCNYLIYKVDCQHDNYISSSWPINGNPQSLSVTTSHNLLVALRENVRKSDANSLCEYSAAGVLIRQIQLQPAAGVMLPVHAVQLSQDRYAITHHRPEHQFSVVDSRGQVVHSYRSDAGNLNEPHGITVDKRGRVLVADQKNNRILVIDSKDLSAYPLSLRDCELSGPYSLHYDAANNRLYIGEWTGRIICCKLL